MNRTLLVVTLILFTSKIWGQEKAFPNNGIKRKFIFEDLIMVTSTDGELFPIFNNEVSLSYGITNWFAIGVFYDFYYSTIDGIQNRMTTTEHLPGLKLSLSASPLLNKYITNTAIRNFTVSFNSYFSYDGNGGIHFFHTDKKDLQKWVNYFKLDIKYILNNHFFLSGSAGIVNTNRFMLGGGVKF